jgi:hypothetical protein
MRDSDIPALGDHRIAAIAAFAPEAGLRFSTFSVNDSEFEFHFVFPFNGKSTLEAVAPRRGAKSASACCWFLLLVSVGSLVVNGGCCAALCFQRLQK